MVKKPYSIIYLIFLIHHIFNPSSVVTAKKLIVVGQNRRTSLVPYNTLHTPKVQQCFSRCHYDKGCYSMEIIQTTFYLCNFIHRSVKPTDLADTQSPETKVYLQIRNCQDLYNIGIRSSGSYKMSLFGQSDEHEVPCHFDAEGGWIVFQRRVGGGVNFDRNWVDYKNGFGEFSKGSLWLGNEILHQITNHKKQQVKVEISSFSGASTTASYGSFRIKDASDKYRLEISELNPGMDVFVHAKNMSFTTRNSDYDGASYYNCAESFNRGGFWYNSCGIFMPNGVWYDEENSYKPKTHGWKGMRLDTLSHDYTLNSTLMMIRPADP